METALESLLARSVRTSGALPHALSLLVLSLTTPLHGGVCFLHLSPQLHFLGPLKASNPTHRPDRQLLVNTACPSKEERWGIG